VKRSKSKTSRMIQARYAAKCQACGLPIARGDAVWYKLGAGVRCPSCGKHPEDATPAAEVQVAPVVGADGQPVRVARRDSDGVHRIEFESPMAVVAYARRDVATTEDNRQYLTQSLMHYCIGCDGTGPGDRWTNYYDYERLMNDSANPPAALLDAVSTMREQLLDRVAPPQAPRRRVRRGQDYGDEIDPDRFVVRNPSLWSRVDRELQPRRTVTLGVNLPLALAAGLTQSCGVGRRP